MAMFAEIVRKFSERRINKLEKAGNFHYIQNTGRKEPEELDLVRLMTEKAMSKG